MESRLELQTLFETILDSRNVYFNPPESVKMKYPAIVYSRARPENLRANNSLYKKFNAYEVTVISERPDSEIVDIISQLPMCSWDRQFVANNLYHDVFTIYYK